MQKIYLCLLGRMCNCFKFILIVIAMGVTEEGFCKNLGYSNSAITDYFRSNTVNSGSGASWGLKSSWESSNDNITWSPATEVPTSAANIITIRNGFNIDIKSGSESADQLIIEAGAILTFSNGSFTVDDGSGTDMVLAGANSNFIISSNTDPSIIGNSLVRINSGAKITLSGNSNIAFYQTNQFSYADASNFEYAGTNIPVIQITFFQNQDVNAIPLFIYNSVIGSALGGVGATTINGKLEVSLNKTMNVSNVGGTLTVRNGIIGAGNYVNSTSSVTNITGASAEIGGTGNLDSYISIANGSTTTLTSNKSYLTLNVFIVNGIYDLGTNRISVPNGASTITVGNTGTLRTANINGLTGAGSIGANLVLSTLPNGSTVEYYSTFPQVVTALSYQNITLNGNSIKTASGPLTFGAAAQNPLFNINAGFLYLGGDVTFATGTIGVMTIANGATLNTANSTNQLTGSNVASIQVNGKFVTQHTGGFNGTSTAVPGIPIILNINSTVEFGGTNQAFQSLASGNLTGFPTNIIFSGSGIKTGGSISTLSSGLITIRNTVIVNATAGASFGVTASALTMEAFSQLIIAGSGTQPNMGGLYTLEPTSTIEFAGTSGSIIRLSPIYANLIVSGINISNTSTTTGINFQSSTFTVKNGATFSLRNLTGFSNTSGVGTTAISNISAFNPTIILEPNSTINYDGITNQVITNTIPYQNLKFSGTSLKTAPLTNLLIEGNLTRAAISTFSANGGRVVFQGSIAQTFTDATGLPPIEFYNLSNTNTSNVIVNNSFAVQNELNLTPAAKLYLNTGDIILRSTNLNTAYITSLGTAIPSTLVTYNNGRFQIERYLRARSSWRLLATPVEISSSPSITNSWREGELVGTNSVSQYGTRITGPTGMDEFTQRYSMKSYNGNNNNYAEVNTPAKLAGQLANNEGYYIFVRGDRTVGVVGLGSTTLRMKGKIRTGDQTFSVPANILPSAGFQSIGNPYPSAIDFRFIDKKNIAESYYIWNPDSLGEYGVGKFEQYSLQGIHYTKTPGGDIRDSIQSGEAFFVQSITGGTVIIKENYKVGGSKLVSREEISARTGVTTPTIEINLNSINADQTSTLLDGVRINFDGNFSNEIDNKDVRKINNTVDNLAIRLDSKNLIVERRNTLTATDTIFLSLTNTRIAPYRFEIDPSVLGNLPLNGYLMDKFLQKETQLSLTDVTNINFNITTDAASRAADRFMIVFKAAIAPGQFTGNFIAFVAEKNSDKTNTLKWSYSNESNIAHYSVERSNNGTVFTGIGNKNAGNLSNIGSYIFRDSLNVFGTNYYRVKATSTRGLVQYSAMVKVVENDPKPLFVVQPNPVENKTLHINFEKLIGDYNLRLIAKQGATILSSQITISSANEVKNIVLGDDVAAGVYELILVDTKGKKLLQTVYIK